MNDIHYLYTIVSSLKVSKFVFPELYLVPFSE